MKKKTKLIRKNREKRVARTRRTWTEMEWLKMELFAKLINSLKPSIVFTKSSILDVSLGPKSAFEFFEIPIDRY